MKLQLVFILIEDVKRQAFRAVGLPLRCVLQAVAEWLEIFEVTGERNMAVIRARARGTKFQSQLKAAHFQIGPVRALRAKVETKSTLVEGKRARQIMDDQRDMVDAVDHAPPLRIRARPAAMVSPDCQSG